MTEKVKEYILNMRRVVPLCMSIPDGLYSGIDGHRRLARECGCALNDFSSSEQEELIKASYSSIYVIGCKLKPILSAREWMMIMRSQIKTKEF